MQEYEKRLHIPITGNDTVQFYTKGGLLVGNGYNRIVIGKRGPYIEFRPEQIIIESITIPSQELWRTTSEVAYYVEYRTTDVFYVKVYFQTKEVDYADYKIGHYYMSPFDLKSNIQEVLIDPITANTNYSTEKFF